MGTLLLVHAHPDDEAISTGGVMMKAKAHGHRVVLATATRGEVGEIHNMDEETSRPRLGEIRTEELKAAAEILGVDRVEFLGYRDSGMVDTADNKDPRSFHQAPLDEAAAKLIYLALRNIVRGWKIPAKHWQSATNQFAIVFGERFFAPGLAQGQKQQNP